MKKEIRILGFDDGPFEKKSKKCDVLVVGTLFRGGSFLDGVISTKIKKDGLDSTKKLIDAINNCKFKPQIQCILLDGIAFGGFNIVDVDQLNAKTKIPVVTIMRTIPNFERIKKALSNLTYKKKRWETIKKAGVVHKIGNIFIQAKGVDLKSVKELLNITCIRSNIPEPIRVAHIIASGIVKGESKGDA